MKRATHKDTQRRPKGRYRFTKADCQKGYQRALEKCSQDWDLHAWFFRRVRGFYDKQRRDHGQATNGRRRPTKPAA